MFSPRSIRSALVTGAAIAGGALAITTGTAALGANLAHAYPLPASAYAPASTDGTCYEDQWCFVWSKDGNGQRGVTTIHGRHVVVGPCRFARMDAYGRIDWARTPALRGDYSARKACGWVR